jgi:hypothetical protein
MMHSTAMTPLDAEQPMPKRVSVAAPSDQAPSRAESA